MGVNTYYTQELHGPFETYAIGDLKLEEGGALPNCQLAYTTHGKLNAARDNAVLVPTWYSGTSKIMEQIYVGDGPALDPGKYFIIVVNQIGSGLSSSPHNTPAPFEGPRFPKIRIGDDVRAQHTLLTEKFGIEQLALVFGGSMGAQQTYEWAVRYPDMVKRAAALAGTAKNLPHTCVMADVVNDILKLDPAFKDGLYGDSSTMHSALRKHAKFFTVIGWCGDFLQAESWRGLGFSSLDEFMTGFMEGYFLPMDPNNLLTQAWKWQRGDISRHTGGDLKAALARIKAKVMVMPIETDLIFPPAVCEAEAKMIPNSQFRVIQSKAGHLGLFAVEPTYLEQVDRHLEELLATPV